MRSSNSKMQGKVEEVNSESPLENGISPKEEEDCMGQDVRELAEKVVDDVVKMASVAVQLKTLDQNSTPKNRGCNFQRLPTIQIDTVPSAPPSPVDLTPPDESTEEPINESDIQLDLGPTEQNSESSIEDLRESVQTYVEDILSQAMVLAEKKLQFAGLPEEEEEEEDEENEEEAPIESVQSSSEPEKEIDDSEIRATAEKVVQEVIRKASETAAQKLENGEAGLSDFPIKFDEAPEDVKEAATNFVKEIVGRAVAMAEEKSTPTVPFNFEDVDLMKTSGPWYIRAREALIRLLRTACFCTPRRTDS